ncbi:MAG: Smr/MutS family protein [Candidatus Cloacimonetes bacterium]|nr:Smr/MutS family protein [Candidatus Cloacimonadota bacterium]
MNLCNRCGNEIGSQNSCPFCGNHAEAEKSRTGKKYSVVNVKRDMPTCDEAVKLLSVEINKAKQDGVKILKIIHGYGSSGKGGELRWCLRQYLSSMIANNYIGDFLAGENLTSNSDKGSLILSRFPQLRKDSDFNRNNRGITFIVL